MRFCSYRYLFKTYFFHFLFSRTIYLYLVHICVILIHICLFFSKTVKSLKPNKLNTPSILDKLKFIYNVNRQKIGKN